MDEIKNGMIRLFKDLISGIVYYILLKVILNKFNLHLINLIIIKPVMILSPLFLVTDTKYWREINI